MSWGTFLVNGLNDRRRRILADDIQDVSKRLGHGGAGRHLHAHDKKSVKALDRA